MSKAGALALPSLALNVPALAGRSEAEVATYLGPPDPGATSTDPSRTKFSYCRGRVEVVFVDGMATWIKAYGRGDLPFSQAALTRLGLPMKRPTYRNGDHVLSWHNLPRLREVSLYGGGPHGTVSSVLVCVQTAPQAPGPRSRWRLSLSGRRAVR